MREVHLYELNELQSVQGTPSQVIILIQGTFSRNASWTKPGSAFLKGIRKSAPNDSLILGFTWTGKNCALAREKAALKLRQHLLASAEKYPCAPHVLIGHSHGGNIALRAASRASTSSQNCVPVYANHLQFSAAAIRSQKRKTGALGSSSGASAALYPVRRGFTPRTGGRARLGSQFCLCNSRRSYYFCQGAPSQMVIEYLRVLGCDRRHKLRIGALLEVSRR